MKAKLSDKFIKDFLVKKAKANGYLKAKKHKISILMTINDIPGKYINKNYRCNESLIITNDFDVYIFDHTEYDFSKDVGKTVNVYVNISSGFKWIAKDWKKREWKQW